MATARVFRDGKNGPDMGGLVFRWETFSRCEADWASGFTISFIFESLEIQKWEAIWLWPSPFVKVPGIFFVF
jgi:hypothetical protein